MISNDCFILTVPKGSVLHRTDGTVVLDKIPENAFDLWKEGEYVFALKKSGAVLLENLTPSELEVILNKRQPINNLFEIKLIETAIKAAKKKNK